MNNLIQILRIFPGVLASVTSSETNLPGVDGASKKQIILDVIQAAAKTGESVPVPLVALISTVIDLIVSALNKHGAFHTSTPVVAPPQA